MIQTNQFLIYWKSQNDWYYLDEHYDLFFPTVNAPIEALESFVCFINYYERKGVIKKRTRDIYKYSLEYLAYERLFKTL